MTTLQAQQVLGDYTDNEAVIYGLLLGDDTNNEAVIYGLLAQFACSPIADCPAVSFRFVYFHK